MSLADEFLSDVGGQNGAPSGSLADQFLADAHGAQTPAAAHQSAPWSVQLGNLISNVPHQLGLTARYAIEGPAQALQIVTEPVRHLTDLVLPDRGNAPKSLPLEQVASNLADSIGLPKPANANERVVGDAARLGFGTMAGSGIARLAQAPSDVLSFVAANKPAQLGPTVGQSIANTFASNPGQQVAAAVGSGVAGGSAREAGASPAAQVGASFLGGIAGGLSADAAQGLYNAGKSLLARLTPVDPSKVDQQISVLLNRSGIDYSTVPERARQAMRDQVAAALKTGGEVNPAALGRLADFALVNGATPTRGMISLDPVQITQEQNLAKIGANTTDAGLHGLPMIQNRNNAALIQNLNDAGATKGDLFNAGANVIGAINAKNDALGSGVSALYSQARDSAGRSAPLNGAAFTANANAALDQMLLGGALPQSVANHMNAIAQGKVPFNVDYAEQLKTTIGNLQRATNDGQTRMALGVVRKALDDTPLLPAEQVNPGNLPAVAGTVPASPAVLGQDAIDAFNQARQSARSRFAWQDSAKPIGAALNDAQPDKFVQNFVINGTLKDAQAIADNAPKEDVKNAILSYLKNQALNGASDEVGKFSQSAYNKALINIGDRKLSLFFSPDELNQVKALGRVASYMQVQPTGAAVNNSNSGALAVGKAYDALKGVLNKVPGGEALFTKPLTNIEIAVKNNAAKNVVPALLNKPQAQPLPLSLMLPGLVLGGSLAAPQ